jgi:hypothetical protein
MTKRGFSVTFERYLPHGDDEDICEADEREFVIEDVSLRDAMRLGLEYLNPDWAGHCEPDCHPVRGVRWLSFDNWNDGTDEYFRLGITERRALHIPDHISESSRIRICKLFGAVR